MLEAPPQSRLFLPRYLLIAYLLLIIYASLYPFSGWRDSFLGVLHGQGRDAVEFYTDKKIVVERWPKAWSRKF